MSDLPTNLLTEDNLTVAAQTGQPRWGIFSNPDGEPILEANSVLNVEYARDYNVSDYPQEQGAFQSYNKVKIPFLAKITYVISDLRSVFLNSIEEAVASLQFVTVVTPEISYPSANLTHYDYRRQKENSNLINVTVWCREVRLAGQTQLSNTETGVANIGAMTQTGSTNAASPAQGGTVQPTPAINFTAPGVPAGPNLEPPT